ncbi:hypothetical protein BAE44_0014276, partial [Dichanthelium oligosanthes]
LPTELLSEALLCLPAKELCRLRLVGRAWWALTSEPRLATAHSSRHPLFAGVSLGAHKIRFLDHEANTQQTRT